MKKIRKYFLILIGLVAVFILVAIAFSPYGSHDGYDYKLIKENIVIHKSADEVFSYLGNSNNAADWSVFVDHINTINGAEVPDGQVGSVRRCFEHADEALGATWDEETILSVPSKQRRLSCYNLSGFPITVSNLMTDQWYTAHSADTCTLSFTLYVELGKGGWFDALKLYLGGYEVARIFNENLENIKKYCELEAS